MSTKTKIQTFDSVMTDVIYHRGMVKIWKEMFQSSTKQEDKDFYKEAIRYHKSRVKELRDYANAIKGNSKGIIALESKYHG
jgi:adenylate kinase